MQSPFYGYLNVINAGGLGNRIKRVVSKPERALAFKVVAYSDRRVVAVFLDSDKEAREPALVLTFTISPSVRESTFAVPAPIFATAWG